MLLANEQLDPALETAAVLYPLTDHLGTARDLAVYDEGTGDTSIASHRVFDAFGNLISETDADFDTEFKFTGRYFDEATGQQWNLNRWYDPTIGQWLSEDPIGFDAEDASLRRYVVNSPISSSDPDGRSPLHPPFLGGDGEGSYEIPSIAGEFDVDDLIAALQGITDSEDAKDEAITLAFAIAGTFNSNGIDKTKVSKKKAPAESEHDPEHRVKGYLCWEWANAFYDAAEKVLTPPSNEVVAPDKGLPLDMPRPPVTGKYFSVELEAARIPPPTETSPIDIHVWLKVTARDTRKSITIDDGFTTGKYVHTGKAPVPGRYAQIHYPKILCDHFKRAEEKTKQLNDQLGRPPIKILPK